MGPEGSRPAALPPAGWHADPYGRFPQRYWDGARWTEHVADGTTVSQDVVAPPGTVVGNRADPGVGHVRHSRSSHAVDRPGPDDSLSVLAADAAGGCVADMLIWLAPVALLGGVGLVLLNAGSEETIDALGRTQTELSSTGWVGAAFVAFAVALFFGRGTIRALSRVVRGQGRLGDLVFMQGNIVSLGIALLAVLAGVFALAVAAGVLDLSSA